MGSEKKNQNASTCPCVFLKWREHHHGWGSQHSFGGDGIAFPKEKTKTAQEGLFSRCPGMKPHIQMTAFNVLKKTKQNCSCIWRGHRTELPGEDGTRVAWTTSPMWLMFRGHPHPISIGSTILACCLDDSRKEARTSLQGSGC